MLYNYSTIIYLIAGIYLTSICLTFILQKLSYKFNIIDIPNQRSMHSVPTPRTGGLAIIFTFILASVYLTYFYNENLATYHLCCLYYSTVLITWISFVDDCRDVSVTPRLAIQAIATSALLYLGFVVNIPYLPLIISYIFSFLFIMWLTNLYNFMDGLDGFASGMATIGYGTFAFILYLNNYPGLALVNLIISIASLGVLTFNFPPAKIFLGDVGSATIGFFTAGMAIILHNQGIIAIWQSIIIFSPFIVDATVTILKRSFNRESIFQPHRTHYFQKLALLIGKEKTLYLYYFLMSVCSFIAILANKPDFLVKHIIILYVFIAYVVLITSMELKFLKSKDTVEI